MGEAFIRRRGGVLKPTDIIEEQLIVNYFGNEDSVPDGWFVCDGQNNTPDLRNMFTICSGDLYDVNNTGGSPDSVLIGHGHTGSTSAIGNHGHNLNSRFTSGGGQLVGRGGGTTSVGSVSTTAAGAHSHGVSINSAGESRIGKNIPPYKALIYIMKGEN